MASHHALLVTTLVTLAACGPGTATDVGESIDDNAGETETGETETETGDDEPSCDCVELERICTADAHIATNDCELPSPCGTVNGDASAAQCALELLVAQEPARFFYSIDGPGCGLGGETWAGWFYILGPGIGLDNECYSWWCDFNSGENQEARYYAIEDPAYFADCIGKTASVMTGCIFNGLTLGGAVPECGG